MYHFIPTLSSLDNLLLTESNPSLEVTVLAQGRRDKNYKGRIQIKVYLTQKTGLLTTMLGLCKNSRITSLDYLICFRQNAAFKYHFIRCTFTKATALRESLVCIQKLSYYSYYRCSVAKSCPTLCNPTFCSQQGSSDGISQVRILEWVAVSSSREFSLPRDRTCVSCTGKWILYH